MSHEPINMGDEEAKGIKASKRKHGPPGASTARSRKHAARKAGVVTSHTNPYVWHNLWFLGGLALAEGIVIFLLGVASQWAYYELILRAPGDWGNFAAISLLVAVLFCGAATLIELSRPIGEFSGWQRRRDRFVVWCITFLLVSLLAFLLKIGTVLSRGAYLAFFASGIVVAFAGRSLLVKVIADLTKANSLAANGVILVGARESLDLIGVASELTESGAEPAVVTVNSVKDDKQWSHERMQATKTIMDLARVAGHGEIYVVSAGFAPERLETLLASLQIVPRALRLIPSAAVEHLVRLRPIVVGNFMSLELQRAPLNRMQRGIKRAIDLGIAAPLGVFLIPLFAALALAIKLDSAGPVFFRQRRLGYRGEAFNIYKFRTMRVLEDGKNVVQAKKNDQRVTHLGRWLRKTSLDELPQIFNVLMGDMSLIGPRPHPIALDEYYTKLIEHYELRQHVKPGITGWAQVNGLRGETAAPTLMEQRIEHDIWYAKNASISLDIEILFRTIVELFRQRNAY